MVLARHVATGLGRIAIYVAILIVFLIPFLWMLFGSLRPDADLFASLKPLSIFSILPHEFTLSNFADILGLSAQGRSFGYRFGQNLLNSVMVTTAVVAGNLVLNTLAAYFFSRSLFPAKELLFVAVLAIMLVPWQATVVPLFLVVHSLAFANTYAALIVPWIANPFEIFFLRVMFSTLPRDLDEAAMIDGASRLGVLWHVLLPNAKAALVTMGLLEFQDIWNQFFWPLVAVSSPGLQVIQVAIQSQTTETQTYWGRTLAGAVLASLPVLVFVALQRYYTRGIALTGSREG